MKDLKEKEILEYLERKEYADTEEIAAGLYVSPSTVRRKLAVLAEKGLVIRVHGGAKIAEANSVFPTFTFRSHQNPAEKKKIALKAIKLIKDGDLIFLDGSTSSYFIAEALGGFKNVRVLTNGIDTLSLLSQKGVQAYSTGGKISDTNRSVLVGQTAIGTVKKFYADVCFFSAQAVLENGEIYDCFDEETDLRQTMLEQSGKKVFLCDKTKFGTTSRYRVCSVKDVDYLVTNDDVRNYFGGKFAEKLIFKD